MITHNDWKTDKKKCNIVSPKNDQKVGITLDKFHKEKDPEAQLKLLSVVKTAFVEYEKANQNGTNEAKAKLKSLLIDCKLEKQKIKEEFRKKINQEIQALQKKLEKLDKFK